MLMPWKITDAMDQKIELIRYWKNKQVTITELSSIFGVSRKTAYKWIKRYEEEGPLGLIARPRTPFQHPNVTDNATVEKIISAKKQYKRWGPKKILAWLTEKHPEETFPAASTIGGILEKEGLVRKKVKRHKTPPYTDPFSECDKPNAVWSADFKGQFRTANRRYCYPLTITDNYSRYLLLCKGFTRPTYKETRKWFEVVFEEYGLPDAIRTDNGTPFASLGICGLSKLSAWFIKLGIVPERIEPGHPEQNGRHERMHRELKRTTANPPEKNLKAQQKSFDEFSYEYNFERPHEALGQQTPVSFYQKSKRNYTPKLPEVSYEYKSIIRKVNRNGEIKCKQRAIYIGKSLIGEHIALKKRDKLHWEIWFSHYPLGILDIMIGKVLPMSPV
jgi:putative transposase